MLYPSLKKKKVLFALKLRVLYSRKTRLWQIVHVPSVADPSVTQSKGHCIITGPCFTCSFSHTAKSTAKILESLHGS